MVSLSGVDELVPGLLLLVREFPVVLDTHALKHIVEVVIIVVIVIPLVDDVVLHGICVMMISKMLGEIA